MGSVAGLIAHADGDDHLMVTIDCSLSVVALDPAVTALENVAVGVRVGEAFRLAVIALGLAFGSASSVGEHLP